MQRLPIVQFRGSRFNILFQNAGGVFFLKEKMVSFLDQHGADNRLTKAVAADLKVPELLAGCKALGLICRLVTQPLWSTLEDKSIHILDMNKKYSELLDFFTTANADIPLFMKGGILPFGDDTYVHEDQVYRCLVADDDVCGDFPTHNFSGIGSVITKTVQRPFRRWDTFKFINC